MNILGYNYTIHSSEVFNEHASVMGRQHSGKLEIWIDTKVKEQQQVSTVLHETIEAINYLLGLSLTEQQIRGVETGLFQTLTTAGVDLTPLLMELKP